MKQLILLIIISLSVSTSAFATATTPTGVSDVEGQSMRATAPAELLIGKASKGVLFGWRTAATGYSISTYHTSGTKSYGTSYDSTALYFSDIGENQAGTFAAPSSSVAEEAFAGWNEM